LTARLKNDGTGSFMGPRHCDHRVHVTITPSLYATVDALTLPEFHLTFASISKTSAVVWFAVTNDEDTGRKGSITSFSLFCDKRACFLSHQHALPPSIYFIPFTRVHSS
jgi:hypothetical protein